MSHLRRALGRGAWRAAAEEASIAELRGIDFEPLSPLDREALAMEFAESYPEKHFTETEELVLRTGQPKPAVPARVGPHELAENPDFSRSARHEAGVDALLGSEPWRVLCEPQWVRLWELGIFAPLTNEAWIDGVIDLCCMIQQRTGCGRWTGKLIDDAGTKL